MASLFAQKLQGFNGNTLYHCYTLVDNRKFTRAQEEEFGKFHWFLSPVIWTPTTTPFKKQNFFSFINTPINSHPAQTLCTTSIYSSYSLSLSTLHPTPSSSSLSPPPSPLLQSRITYDLHDMAHDSHDTRQTRCKRRLVLLPFWWRGVYT